MNNRYWERIHGFISEHPIDARYILREEDDPNDPPKAWGSLRIVGYDKSYGRLPTGHLRAFASFVTSRRPRTEQEMKEVIENYQMEEIEMEVYSVNEKVETNEMVHEGPKYEIEETFGVKIFRK